RVDLNETIRQVVSDLCQLERGVRQARGSSSSTCGIKSGSEQVPAGGLNSVGLRPVVVYEPFRAIGQRLGLGDLCCHEEPFARDCVPGHLCQVDQQHQVRPQLQ